MHFYPSFINLLNFSFLHDRIRLISVIIDSRLLFCHTNRLLTLFAPRFSRLESPPDLSSCKNHTVHNMVLKTHISCPAHTVCPPCSFPAQASLPDTNRCEAVANCEPRCRKYCGILESRRVAFWRHLRLSYICSKTEKMVKSNTHIVLHGDS